MIKIHSIITKFALKAFLMILAKYLGFDDFKSLNEPS